MIYNMRGMVYRYESRGTKLYFLINSFWEIIQHG